MSRPRLTVFVVAVAISALSLFTFILDARLADDVIPPSGMSAFVTATILCWAAFMTLTVVEHVDRGFSQLHTAIAECAERQATEAAVAAIAERQAIPVARLHPQRP